MAKSSLGAESVQTKTYNRDLVFELDDLCEELGQLISLLKIVSDSKSFDAAQRMGIRAIHNQAELLGNNFDDLNRVIGKALGFGQEARDDTDSPTRNPVPSPARAMQERASTALCG